LNHSLFARTILFTLTSFFMVMCIPFLEQSTVVNKSIQKISIVRFIFTKISLYSYMIYLIHLDLFIYCSKFSTSLKSSIVVMSLTFMLTFFISGIVYKYYEKPIMDLRDKLKLTDGVQKDSHI
jgi:peptidoglycan/LPS O-acetylase OafA/YrhL